MDFKLYIYFSLLSKITLIKKYKILFFLIVFLQIHTVSFSQFYFGSQQDFGKNRIQYKSRFWNQMNYDRYDVFLYLNGKNYAQFVSQVADKAIAKVETDFEHEFSYKMQFLVYNKQHDFNQSNVGLASTSDINIGGTTNLVENKIFLYYPGNYIAFEKQIVKGIASLALNKKIYGENFTQAARSSAFINLPNWFISGLASCYADKWNIIIDNEVRDAILNNKYNDLSRISEQKAEIVGHSLWNFIIETYGFSTVNNILEMTRATRNVENGFEYVLGIPLDQIIIDWKFFYTNKYEKFDDKLDKFNPKQSLKINTRKGIVTQTKISSDARQIAYAINYGGKVKIYLHDIANAKSKVIFKHGDNLPRAIDNTTPQLAWHPSGEFVSFIFEYEGGIWLYKYEIKKQKLEKRQLFNFEKINSFSYALDGKKFVMAAVQNGLTDIFVYNIASNVVERVTNDYDLDADPIFINKSTEIVFSSTRLSDTLQPSTLLYPVTQKSDLFLYNYIKKENVLKRLTSTPNASEYAPLALGINNLLFLGDNYGTVQQYKAKFDSAIDYIDTAIHYKYTLAYAAITNGQKNILLHDYVDGKLLKTYLANNKHYLQLVDLPNYDLIPTKNIALSPYYLSKSKFSTVVISNSANKQEEKALTVEEKNNPNYIDIDNYVFEFEKESNREEKEKSKKENEKLVEIIKNDSNAFEYYPFQYAKQLNYNKYFLLDNVVSQLDNSLLNSNYQAFSPGQPFVNPGINSFVKFGISDLFQNDRFSAGYRLGFNLRNNEFFASYELLEKRLDKSFLFHRQSLQSENLVAKFRQSIKTNEFKYNFKYPFSETTSIRNTITLRNDQLSTFSVDDETLKTKNIYNTWGVLKSEFIFDNALSLGLNLQKGTKFKLFVEYYNQVNKIRNNIFIVGGDYRRYIPLFREIVLANRLAGSSSMLGSQNLIYYLGGVDNWLFSNFNNDTRIDLTKNYVFQSIGTNMRGFNQNIRNGNSFVVINEELRIPIFRVFTKKIIASEFFKNFQVIGFYDAGIAWTGPDPYSDQNILFTRSIVRNNGIHEFVLKNYENPIVMGYGIGVRAKLLGYFLRLDLAQGLKDGVPLESRQFYFSLGLDF